MKSVRRREELRRNLPKPAFDARALIQRPEVVKAALIVLAFILTTGLLIVWSREQVRVVDGQIMTDTRLTRVEYWEPDQTATEVLREEARLSADQVWHLNQNYLDRLAADLNGLPKAVAGKASIADIAH